MTIKDVTLFTGLSWDVVKSIQKRNLKKRFKKPNLKNLSHIAIDEIHREKGRCLTVALDLKTGAVVFVGDGKGSDALKPFWKRVKRHKSVKIKAVAADMSSAYKYSALNNRHFQHCDFSCV
jgi:transposase